MVKKLTIFYKEDVTINFKAKILLIFFLLIGTIFSMESTEDVTYFKPEYRLVAGIFTTHTNDNDLYNNNINLIGLEYRPQKDFGINLGYFKNSFYNDSYILSAGKYFRPSKKFEDFYFSLGLGVVKGYEKVNYIYRDGEVVKKAKFNTNIGEDFIIGGSVGTGYDITDYLSINIFYVGAFVSAVTLKL